jgi:hypothetical protein
MNDQEKQLLNNLAGLIRSSRLTADEHEYFMKGLQGLVDKLEGKEAPALAPVPAPAQPQ